MKVKRTVIVAVMLLLALCVLLACSKKKAGANSTSDAATDAANPGVTNSETSSADRPADENDEKENDSASTNGDAASSNIGTAPGNSASSSTNANNTQNTTVTPHTHVPVKDDAVEATCQKTGLTEGSHCSVCGEVLAQQQSIPKVDHKYENGICIWCGETDPHIALIDELGEFELPPIPG